MHPAESLADRFEARYQHLREATHLLRQSGRALLRARGFTLLAVLTLALGIGASTAVYALADAVALRALPYAQPQQLVAMLETSQRFPQMGLSWPDAQDWQASTHAAFSALAAFRGSDMILDHLGSAPAMILGRRVTANYFSMLGVSPELGRTFTSTEDSAAGPDVVVVSDRFFRSRLGANPAWLGRSLSLDGRARILVGVMPASFPGIAAPASTPEIWTPLGAYAAQDASMSARGNHAGILVIARLRAGVSLPQANAAMRAVTSALAQAHPETNAGVSASLTPYREFLLGPIHSDLLALLIAAALLLLVACASVANLSLARAASRRRESAIRCALGASSAALVRRALADGLWLGVGGCATGIALASAALRALPAAALAQLPRAGQVALDPAVVAVACGTGLACSLLFALAPVWQARRTGATEVLHARSSPPARFRGALIVVEVALSALLLFGGGLLLHSLVRLNHVDLGFQPQGTLSFIMGLPDTQYPTRADQRRFFERAQQRLATLPGVASAGGVYPLPFGNGSWEQPFLITGAPAPTPGHEPTAHFANVLGDYFGAMQIPLRRGRLFNDQDQLTSTPVILVDTVFARRYFGNENPLGRQIAVDGPPLTIVGVVAHVQDRGPAAAPAPEVYYPQAQSRANTAALSFVLRTRSGDPMALRARALAQLVALDPDQPATDVAPVASLVAAATAPQRQMLLLVGAFALLALLIALVGVYGLIAYAVARRTQEIGIRMALGAARGHVLAGVLLRALALAAAGAALGLAAGLALSHLVASLLYGVAPSDPATLAGVAALLLIAAVLAAFVPAMRASRTDPCIALRAE